MLSLSLKQELISFYKCENTSLEATYNPRGKESFLKAKELVGKSQDLFSRVQRAVLSVFDTIGDIWCFITGNDNNPAYQHYTDKVRSYIGEWKLTQEVIGDDSSTIDEESDQAVERINQLVTILDEVVTESDPNEKTLVIQGIAAKFLQLDEARQVELLQPNHRNELISACS